MKFIRHLLSHLMFIILISGIGAVYYFRYQVIPENFVEKIDFYAEKIHPGLLAIANPKRITIQLEQVAAVEDKKQVVAVQADVQEVTEPVQSSETPEVKNEENTVELNETVEKPEPIADVKEPDVKSSDVVAAPAEKEVVVSSKDAEPKEIVKPVVTVAEKKNDAVIVNETPVPEAAPVVIVKTEELKKPDAVAENKPTEEKVAAVDKEAASYKKILHEARSAYGKGNMKLSVKKYSELIELENHEADFHGELGNVYYTMGNWEKAGAAYYEAALRLIDRGQLAQVGYLQKVIQGLDTERAEKLAKQLTNKSR